MDKLARVKQVIFGEKFALVKKTVLAIIHFPATVPHRLKSGYKTLNHDIEEALAEMDSGSRFVVTHVLMILVALVGCSVMIHADNIEDASPFDLFPSWGWWLLGMFLLWVCGYIWIRYCGADSIAARDARIKNGSELIPDTWFRLGKSVKHSPDTIIDYDNFSRNLVYASMSDWQRAISDKAWVEKAFSPRGYKLEDYYAIYRMEAGRKKYTNFDFYLRKGEDLVHIAMYPSEYEVELVEMKRYDERYEYKIYDVKTREGRSCRQISQVLKEMYAN